MPRRPNNQIGGARPPRWVRGPLLVVVLVVATSLGYVMWTEPEVARVGVMTIAALSLVGIGLKSARALLFAAGGAVALSLTSPDLFGIWPTAAALLYASARAEGRIVPRFATAASIVGLMRAVLHADLSPVLPLVVALLCFTVDRMYRRIQGLVLQLAGMTRRSREAEAQARWLEARTELARELHDVVGHHVTAMVVRAEAARWSSKDEALESVAEMGRTALAELDAMIVHLRDPRTERSEVTLTQTSIDRLAQPLRDMGVTVQVNIEPSTESTPGAHVAFRIVQEGLTNIARHSAATSTWVTVETADDDLVIRIEDNGRGIPDQFVSRSGMVGIDERTRHAGGRWEVSARPGGGTILCAALPKE